MFAEIIEQIKTGSIQEVIPFGRSKMPPTPYVIVKPEYREGFRAFRIIVHYPNDNAIDLENYCFNELPTLLDNFQTIDSNGNTNSVYTENAYTDIIIGNDDSSIAMERVYSMPMNLTI